MSRGQVRRRMVPGYLAGSGVHTHNTLESLTALSTTGMPPSPRHNVPQRRIIALLRDGSLTISETAARLRLQIGVCKGLVSELIDDGQLLSQAPLPDALAPHAHAAPLPTDVLERVVSGLRALKN